MNARNKSSINVRPYRSSSVRRVALMIFFILIVTANSGYIARAQQQASKPRPGAGP